MRVILDARNLTMYPPLTAPFHGATEMLLKRLAATLHDAGHEVHVVSVEPEEHYQGGVSWWPAGKHPTLCDVLIAFDRADRLTDFRFQRAHVFCTAVDVPLGGNERMVENFAVLSRAHGKVLRQVTPGIEERQVVIIPPGVEMAPEEPKVPGRMVWCHSPDRGLVHLARMWPRILEAVPHASIRVTYNVADYIARHRWWQDERGMQALEIERWIADNPETVIAGVASAEEVRHEQAVAELCPYPMDPLNAGVGVHALAVAECAAAGCALLLSYHEGLPEVYGACADFLALPVNEDDWVHHIAGILNNPGRGIAMQDKALEWAQAHPWRDWERQWQGLAATGWPTEMEVTA